MSNTWYTHAHTQPGTHAHNPYHLLYLPSSCCQDSWQPCDCEGVVLPASCYYNRWSGVDSTAPTLHQQQPSCTYTRLYRSASKWPASTPTPPTHPHFLDRPRNRSFIQQVHTYVCWETSTHTHIHMCLQVYLMEFIVVMFVRAYKVSTNKRATAVKCARQIW